MYRHRYRAQQRILRSLKQYKHNASHRTIHGFLRLCVGKTRVETVIEYFSRWISKFPTIEALASASEDDVNLMWSGLGYYRRARFLHKGAKTVVNDHGGKLPNTLEGLKAIPGIGDYTAGAIGSIAYKIPTPVVDGNVVRVFSRLKSIAGNPKNSKLINLVWDIAKIAVDGKRPGDFNNL